VGIVSFLNFLADVLSAYICMASFLFGSLIHSLETGAILLFKFKSI
jgi:hypothetical protein